jgi:outer membrane scaffolding protein for murein synthesis (MipA/OmpV family)
LTSASGALANYTRLINDAADSPVVDDVGDENQFFAGALVTIPDFPDESNM